jgi:ubiquitin C-terminal hydrolase
MSASTAWGGPTWVRGHQHDAHEAFSVLFDACDGVDRESLRYLDLPGQGQFTAEHYSSPYWQTFGMVQAWTTRCAGCGLTQRRFEPCALFLLEVPDAPRSLEQLLRHSLPQGEELEDTCDGCRAYGRRSRDLCVARWPRVLVLQLKRWKVLSLHPFAHIKMDTDVSFQADLVPPQQDAPAYRLRGVVVHQGEAGGGHYVSYVRTGGDAWYHCDDWRSPKPVGIDEVLGSMAYMLLYEA